MNPFDQVRLHDVKERMAKRVFRSTTPISKSDGDAGFSLGTGNFVAVDRQVVLVTNEHVVREACGGRLAYLPSADSNYVASQCQVCADPPIDLAVCLLSAPLLDHEDRVVDQELFDSELAAVPGEMMFLLGYPGSSAMRSEPNTLQKRRTTVFGHLHTPAIPMLTQAAQGDQPAGLSDPVRHVGVHFPGRAAQEPGGPEIELPNPAGMSGSLLWDTKLVASHLAGQEWSPAMARVCGLVWGADNDFLYATKVEHFLPDLNAIVAQLNASR